MAETANSGRQRESSGGRQKKIVDVLVSELSPYVEDLDWSDLTEPEQISPVLDYLGRATAKVHCVADKDSDPTIVGFQTEDEIIAALGDGEEEFVDAFRNGQIPGLSRC